MKLPKSYTDMKATRAVYNEATRWLENLSDEPDTYDERMTFSAFYSSHSNLPAMTSTHLLPLISKPVTAPATVRHVTNIVKDIAEKVNPGQVTVITGDQPWQATPVDVSRRVQKCCLALFGF